MKVLAFLQNMWLRDPQKANRMIERDTTGKLRQRLITYALFAGCWTGHRIKVCLGEEWCERIIWDEASPVITARPDGCPPPDPEHIQRTLEKHQPDLIVCFSAPAEPVIRRLADAQALARPSLPFGIIPILTAPHPAARVRGVGDDLRRLRVLLSLFEDKFNSAHATPLNQPSPFVPVSPPNNVVDQP